MLGIHDFFLFLASGLLLNITPGADMLYVMSHAASRGVGAGVLATLGICTGTLLHIGFAMVGLSALLATSATAFLVVKYVGAAYLVYFGVRLLLDRAGRSSAVGIHSEASWTRIYRQGVLINALNPKVALFFLAFLPQFIDVDSPQRVLAFLALGLVFNATGFCVNALAACIVHGAGQHLAGIGHLARWMKKAVGGAFIGLGLKLALSPQG